MATDKALSDAEFDELDAAATRGRIISVGLLALLAVIGFDLFLHAGVLAPLYKQPGPFLLPSLVAFRRIPVGYASFAILIALLLWLVIRLRLAGARRCAGFGLILGGAIWGALALGLFSITTAPPALLVGWAVGQTVELGLAGAIVGAGLRAATLRRVTVWSVVVFIVCVALGILLQNVMW